MMTVILLFNICKTEISFIMLNSMYVSLRSLFDWY